MTVDAFTFGRHGDSFGKVDVFVSPPASQGLAHTALGLVKPAVHLSHGPRVHMQGCSAAGVSSPG